MSEYESATAGPGQGADEPSEQVREHGQLGGDTGHRDEREPGRDADAPLAGESVEDGTNVLPDTAEGDRPEHDR